ncbi:hypothetical protein ACRALDRAFT_2041791 [Sodiomyces alcalophilus JCM 7366]|uniref:uncharacterized protein n=1 Tax=Sodiomyces alcalophilus JCM 7366 TaxID=591952 RepID=UPI0039B57496
MKAGAYRGHVLETPSDKSLGDACKIIPEWNLRDVASSSPDYFLDHLRHRATTTLEQQYARGCDGRPGDHHHIVEMVEKKGLRPVRRFPNCYTFFIDGDKYGQSFEITNDHAGAMAAFRPAINAGLCLPQSTGQLILDRQSTILQLLFGMMEDVLEAGQTTALAKHHSRRPQKAEEDGGEKPTPVAVNLPDLVSAAADQMSAYNEHLALLREEPVVLAYAVNITFFSRPELVPDDRGRILPAYTAKYIAGAVLEAVYSAVRGAVTWSCICRLLEELEEDKSSNNRTRRATIAQELANLCDTEYTRTQGLLRRHVSTSPGLSKWFRRVPSSTKDGAAKVVLGKKDTEPLMREDPQLHHILRLCQPRITSAQSVDWIEKLDALHRSHPEERDNLEPRVADALSDLAAVVGFTQALSKIMTIPAASRKKGQFLVAGLTQIEDEVNALRTKIDLSEFALPIDNLQRPDMAAGALRALDQQILENMGATIGDLHEGLVAEWTKSLHERIQEAQTSQAAQSEAHSVVHAPAGADTETTPDWRAQVRKQKVKTRPAGTAPYDITPVTKDATVEDVPEAKKPVEMHNINPRAAATFAALFTRSENRKPIPWVAFQAAMADMGFSVLPRYGSVYTFAPPAPLVSCGPITLHRPHKSEIEGYRLLYIARRLTRKYGWTGRMFESGGNEET